MLSFPPQKKKKKKKKKLMEISFIIIIDIIQTVGELMGNPPLVQRLTVIINLNTVRTSTKSIQSRDIVIV